MHGALVVGPDYDTVWAHEIINCRAFLEKFRVGDDAEFELRAALVQFFLDCGAHLVGRAYRNCRFVHNDRVVVHMLADVACGRYHVLQIGGTVFVRRRSYGDELDCAVFHTRRHVGSEAQATRSHVAFHHIFQARLVNGDTATLEKCDLALVHVQAQHVVANFRQAGACHETDVAGANNTDVHYVVILKIDCLTWIKTTGCSGNTRLSSLDPCQG